jgi:hypothetical protein
MLGFIGVIEIDTRTAGFTVSVAMFEVTPEKVAVMNAEPGLTDVASPFEAVVLLMVAIAVFDEFHVAQAVRSCTAPPDRKPVAVNCWVVPRTIVALDGVTAIEVTAADVSAVVPEIVPKVAVIVVNPVAEGDAEARPLLVMVATFVSDEFQVTKAVISCVAVFSNVPTAESWSAVPDAMV